ncbi:MAG: metallophosphoesterase [Actinobacteria bacterium]|nr:metallophosphoesterase [Actinomycetota bacterium]
MARMARLVADGCGQPRGTRILHVTDLHNRPAAFRLVSALCRTMTVRLIVTTGDLSGLGGPVEWTLLSALTRWPAPVVFAPGNHDSDLTQRCMRRLGAEVLSEPRLVTVAGVRVWGYPDPNRTVLFGAAHNRELAREAAAEVRPPRGDPYVIAVHSERMVSEIPPGVRLMLCGHLHSRDVRVAGDAVIVRPGAAGGTNPWSGPVRAAVVDLDLPAHAPLGIWLVEIDGNRCRVDEVAVQQEADPAP